MHEFRKMLAGGQDEVDDEIKLILDDQSIDFERTQTT
jgi:hypothetical protein